MAASHLGEKRFLTLPLSGAVPKDTEELWGSNRPDYGSALLCIGAVVLLRSL